MLSPYYLCVKLVGCLSEYVRATVCYLISDICGSCPLYCVLDYALYVRIVIRGAGLVTGLEIEYLSRSAQEAAAASENIAVLVPSAENECVGLWNVEGLAIELLLFN